MVQTDSLHTWLVEIAEREGVSVEQIVASAVAEKMSASMTEEYLRERVRRGSREEFEPALLQIPDVPPEEQDRIQVYSR